MDGFRLMKRRRSASIAGHLVAARAGISRSRLSCIERGHVKPGPPELESISAALDGLIEAKARLAQAAEEFGAAELVR